MYLYVVKWNIHPDKLDAYMNWLNGVIPRTLGIPGVVEFRGYRGYWGHLKSLPFMNLPVCWIGLPGSLMKIIKKC